MQGTQGRQGECLGKVASVRWKQAFIRGSGQCAVKEAHTRWPA